MPFRERTAWLSLAAMIFTFIPYFAAVAIGPFHSDPLPNLRQLGLYAAAAIARVLILGLGYLVLRRAFPQDARSPLDERDRAIRDRGVRFAYYALIAGMILVGCVMPFTYAGWAIVNAALFMIFAAETVQYGAVVAAYRGQS